MNKHVAIAFTTTGPAPKDGHRINELIAVKESDDGTGKQLLAQQFSEAGDAENSFKALFPALVEFVGTAPIIVSEVGAWRRFLRVEVPGIDHRAATAFMKNATETALWSAKKFSKQRKDVASIAQRLGVGQGLADISALAREADQLFAIGGVMLSAPAEVKTSESAAIAQDASGNTEADKATEPESEAAAPTLVSPSTRKTLGTGLLGLRNRPKADAHKN